MANRPPPDVLDAAPEPDPPATALARRAPTSVAPVSSTALTTPVQRAIPALLPLAVAAFGDVVDALLTDLDTVSTDVSALAWLSNSRSALDHEVNYQAAIGQLAWWDSFLHAIPLQAHRAALARTLTDGVLDPADRARLRRIHDDPQPGEWRVDVASFERAAVERLGPMPHIVPITANDLDVHQSFAGYNCVAAMREHPELGPRAAHMDAAVAAALRSELGLDSKTAAAQAPVLTGIFLIALRRSLAAGSHQLAASIELLSRAEEAPVQQQFARELLESWAAHLATIPEPSRGLLGGTVGKLLGKKDPAQLTGSAPRQLTDGGGEKPGLWARIVGKKG